MRIKRVEEELKRLNGILASKNINFQNKIDSLDKCREIEAILSTYPEEPLKGLASIDLDELTALLSYFSKEKYSDSDVKLKKYWFLEACSNPALKDTPRYQDAQKMFVTLADTLQEFLDTNKDIVIDENQMRNNLSLVKQLTSLLKKDELVSNFIMYVPILSPCETLIADDIYNFFIVLANRNIELLRNRLLNPYVHISGEWRNYISSVIHHYIDPNMPSGNYADLRFLIDNISVDYDNIIDLYPNRVREIISTIWDEEKVTDTINHLMIPVTILKGRRQGLEIELSKDDIATLATFLQDLVDEEQKIRKSDIINSQSREARLIDKIRSLELTLGKVEGKLSGFIEIDDFYNIIELVKENNQPFEVIKNVISVLNDGNINASGDVQEVKQITYVTPTGYVKKEEPVASSPLTLYENRFERLLSDYGYNSQEFPSKLLEVLKNTTTYDEIQEIARFIDSRLELHFIKPPVSFDNTNLGQKIKDICYSRIFLLFAYSNPNILNSLIDIAHECSISLRDIFAIPKVFVSVNDEGTYEFFMQNIRLIKDNYPDILHKLVRRCPTVLGVDSELFRRNIAITEAYGMSIKVDSTGAFPSPRSLACNDFEFVMDRYIEVGEYDYIERFRSQLETNYMIALRFRYLQAKGVDIRLQNYVDFSFDFNMLINDYLVNASIENVLVALDTPEIKWLDSINEETDPLKKNIQYLIKGIYISRLKVLKYYSAMVINNYVNKKEALLYSMVKDSFLTKEEFETLKSIVYHDGGM